MTHFTSFTNARGTVLGSTGFYLLMVVIVCALALIGCSESNPQAATPAPVADVAAPVKIATFVDKTGSANQTRVEQITPEDVDPLLELILRRGGEIAIGLVVDESNRGLLRFIVTEPPVEPVEPDPQTNPFILAEQRNKYKKTLRAYEEDLHHRDEDSRARLAVFREELAKLLGRPANAARTDIWGAVQRAELFLDEPDDQWQAGPHKYALLATDGQDNIRKPQVAIRSGAKILIANGSASLADLAALKPLRFESVASAIQYVLSQEDK